MNAGAVKIYDAIYALKYGESRTLEYSGFTMTVTRRYADYMAYVNGSRGIEASGKSAAEAIGEAFITAVSIYGSSQESQS